MSPKKTQTLPAAFPPIAELARALRSGEATSAALTRPVGDRISQGRAMLAHVERALASGFDGYWTKPIDIWQMMQKIDDFAMDVSLKFR